MKFSGFHRYQLLVTVLLVGLAQRLVPSLRAEEPTWLRLNGLPEVSVGIEAEGSTEQRNVNGGTSTYDHISLTPLVGLHTSGSIYHPNLLTFDLGGDLGWGWDDTASSSPGIRETRNESANLTRYLAEFNLLPTKPYNASFFAAQDHSYRDYGAFSTYAVDATRYGGKVSWTEGAFTLNSDLGYRDESDSGINDSSEITETYFNFLGIHQRKFGQTTLTVHANDLKNILNYASPLDTKNWSVGISDSETFGHRKQINASTGLTYSQSEYTGQQINTLNASENITINHRPNLDSYVMLNYDRSELRPITSQQVQGTAGIQHQLYESLTSGADVHGAYQQDSASTGNSGLDQYGVGVSENYAKRLRSWGRLTVGAGVVVDHNDQTSSGATVLTPAEPHQLYLHTSPHYQPQQGYLKRPKVLDVLLVSAGNDTLSSPSDYTLVQYGDLTEIKLVVPASSHLQSLLQTNDNLSVTVTYQSESLNSSYDSLSANVQIRLDLFNHLGIYGRLSWLDNNAPPEVLTQTLTDLVGGVDYNCKWFRTGAEYENYDSNFTQYEALRFFQNFEFVLSSASTLSFDFNQSFYTYADSRDQSQYQFMARYNARLPLSINWYLEGGGLIQNVAGSDQVQGVARTGLSWTRGKLSLRAGYEFNSQNTTSGNWSEDLIKHRFFTYLRRSF